MPPKARFVGIAHIRKLLSVLIAENETYVAGQTIYAVDDVTGNVGEKVGDWDWQNVDISAGTPFVDLPWLVNPAAAGTLGYTPFKIRTTDPQYSAPGADTIITDPRLIGVSDPIVSTTTTGVEFRDEQLVIDDVAGTLTITGFAGMDPTDHISIFVPSLITTGGSITALTARVVVLEKLTSPLAAGAKLWWPFPIDSIPAGWQECEAMRGLLPMAQNPDDVYDPATNPEGMSRAIGTPGGSIYHTNTIAEMAAHSHDYNDTGPSGGLDFGNGSTRFSWTSTATVGRTTGTTGGGQRYSIMNPYLIGCWIELIPIP